MQKIPTLLLGKIFSYSDNCCVVGLSKKFVEAAAKCIGNDSKQTETLRVVGLVKTLRYCAVTSSPGIWKLFRSYADKSILEYKLISELLKNRFHKICDICEFVPPELMNEFTTNPPENYNPRLRNFPFGPKSAHHNDCKCTRDIDYYVDHKEYKNLYTLPDKLYDANSFIIESYNENRFEDNFMLPASLKQYDTEFISAEKKHSSSIFQPLDFGDNDFDNNHKLHITETVYKSFNDHDVADTESLLISDNEDKKIITEQKTEQLTALN